MGEINFDDVYANAYVRESVETLAAATVRQYPMLVNEEEDIRQELWIAVNKRLPLFDSEKSSIETFCRRVLENALKDIRRRYFTSQSITSRTALNIDAASVLDECRNDEIARIMLIADVRSIVMSLDPVQQSICEMIMDGYSMRQIAANKNISVGLLYKKYLVPLRKIFIEAGLQK